MSIKREALDTDRLDFKGVTTGKRLPPIHPGEILNEEFLKPMGLSVYEFANAIKVPRSRANDIVRERRAIPLRHRTKSGPASLDPTPATARHK